MTKFVKFFNSAKILYRKIYALLLCFGVLLIDLWVAAEAIHYIVKKDFTTNERVLYCIAWTGAQLLATGILFLVLGFLMMWYDLLGRFLAKLRSYNQEGNS